MQSESPKIVAADVLPNGLLVTFADRGAALFTAEQLEELRFAGELRLEEALLDAAVLQLQEVIAGPSPTLSESGPAALDAIERPKWWPG